MRWGAFLTLLLVLLVGTFGVWHVLSMNGETSGCPLMTPAAALCGMDPIEHIALWQRFFTAVPHRALALLFVVSALGVALFQLKDLRVHTRTIQARYQAYRRLALAFAPLEPLQHAFSQGILHPKICG